MWLKQPLFFSAVANSIHWQIPSTKLRNSLSLGLCLMMVLYSYAAAAVVDLHIESPVAGEIGGSCVQ